MQTQPRKGRRTANACIQCRQSKIKCSGEEPCANCTRRIVRCRYAEDSNKIVVSERYLQGLRKQAHEQNSSPTGAAIPTPASQIQPGRPLTSDGIVPSQPSGGIDAPPLTRGEFTGNDPSPQAPLPAYDFSIQTNPFPSTSATIKNTHENRRSWIWLAPSSTWSFTVRLTVMLTSKINITDPGSPPSHLGTEIYPLKWRPLPDDEDPDISGLPSIDHALYLFNTVKYHLGQHYRFFDDDSFLQHCNEFYYGDGREKASKSRLWFAQFLLVLAFGTAFLSKSKNPKEPPGAKFFVRAMALIPDLSSVWKDSLLAIEVLAQAGLYLYAIDHRESAHVYVGQAIRIAQLEGLHTRLPEQELGRSVVARCRDLWWTLYIMDRHFSSSLGLPMCTSDSDITTPFQSSREGSREDTILCLQTKLWHLLSVVLNAIYKTDTTELATFLSTTTSILHTLAGHAQEIEDIISVKLHNSVETMSKGTRHITLLYHQCVIVATRPLLLSILKERLDKLGHGDEDWKSFFALTTTLMTTGIKSAVKTLQILSHEDSLLEVFLPFDLEFTYGAALHLIMASTLFPGVADDLGYAQRAHEIFDEMIFKGNMIAKARKSELEHLQILCQEFAVQSKQRGLQTLTLGYSFTDLENNVATQMDDQDQIPMSMTSCDSMTTAPVPSQQDTPHEQHQQLPPPPPPPANLPPDSDSQMSSNAEFLDDIGISAGDFFSIVDQMGSQDIFPNDILGPQPNHFGMGGGNYG